MIKNHFLSFVDWYINNREGTTANYISNNFKNDNEKFIDAMLEYTVEFSISSKFNPFSVEKGKEQEVISRIEKFLKNETTNFHSFSERKSKHIPRALFGSKNYLSYLKELAPSKDIVLQNIEDVTLEVSEEKDKEVFSQQYDFNHLYNNFKFRLITQDRFYTSLNYPISLLKRIFQKYDESNFFDEWLYSHISKIKFHTKNNTFLFSDIDFLEINEEGISYFTDKQGKSYELVDKKDNGEKIELRVKELRDLVIDHIEPFKEFYTKNKKEFIILKKIHNALNEEKTLKKRGKDFSDAQNKILEKYNFPQEAIKQLKKELNFINENVELQMMSRQENLYKKRKS